MSMIEKDLYTFEIDEEFKCLIRPLYKQEYLQLEANIIQDGCRDPITVWQGIIIDGHNRYEICHRHGIPFAYHEMEFECRESVVAWICANQLGRRNLTEETRKYLIGVQYNAEKQVLSIRNLMSHGFEEPTDERPYEEFVPPDQSERAEQIARTSERIARENNIAHSTVEKYAQYARALDAIGAKEPKLLPKILSGRYKVSHKNVLKLSHMEPEEIRSINNRIERTADDFARYNRTRTEIESSSVPDTTVRQHLSVKDTPAFDPDAEAVGLTLTIPSWVSTIERVRTKTQFYSVTTDARDKLINALLNLQTEIMEILSRIRKGDDDSDE